MLRRKRGADYDLEDEDDGGEARRRMKRRQFAKMQRALMADERVSRVAENPRTQAFLRTIEDRGSDAEDDEGMDFLLEPQTRSQSGAGSSSGSLTQSDATAIPDSQPPVRGGTSTEAGMSRGAPSHANSAAGRLSMTRDSAIRAGKKPSTLSEIRTSLSNLLEEPDASSAYTAAQTNPAADQDADGEENDEGGERSEKENHNPRRRGARLPVVDRLTLKRNASSMSSSSSELTSTSSSSTSGANRHRLAFAASSATGAGGPFKVPALLRRATTNSLASASSSGGSAAEHNNDNNSNRNGGAAGRAATPALHNRVEEGKIRKGATRMSGINYFARENERRVAAAESERRREARRWKGAEGRGKVVGGLFGSGKFE